VKDSEIQGLITTPIDITRSISNGQKEKDEKGPSFAETLKNSIEEVNRLQKEADKAIQHLAVGKGKGIHETMIALEKADISFQMMMQIRNKIIEAYQDVMKMQL
jgi:flagellar hook-basal body complex protein FliE